VDRDRIERRDFPTGRRGYDPAAVDEHLRRVADEFEARVHPPPPTPAPSMASSTSEQVRLILEAAERGAAELRTAAGAEASDHVTRVQTAADGMLSKLDALESELNRLLSALRTSGERLAEGLAELQGEAAAGLSANERQVSRAEPDQVDTRAAQPPADAPAPADPAPAAPPATADSPRGAADADPAADAPPAAADSPSAAADGDPAPAAADSPRAAADADPADTPPAGSADSPRGDAAPAEDPAPDSPPLSAPGAPDWPAPTGALFDAPPAEDTLFAPAEEGSAEADDASARLIALNMALSGSSRDDTRVFLEEHFTALPDVEALLDDVYTRAGR
jgi:DivIVA domain-containing protein